MKYLITTSEPNLDAKVSKRFGHAEFYLILDTDTMDTEILQGPSDEEHHSHDFSRFQRMGVQRVILNNIGPGAWNAVAPYGWQIYSCRGTTAAAALKSVEDGVIQPIDGPTMNRSIHQRQGSGMGPHGGGCGNCCHEHGQT